MKENDVYIIIIACLIFVNLYSFYLFWKDKRLAKSHRWRIPEVQLFLAALFGGSLGAILGMNTFSHKTKKASFRIGLPFLLLVNVLFLFVLLKWIN